MAPSPAGDIWPPSSMGKSQAWHAAAVLAVGLALRLNGLGRHPIWLDEANSIHMASRPFLSIPGVLQQDTAPPLYYMLLHYWQLAWGEGPVAVRSLSVIFGLLWIPAVFGLASRVGGRTAGWTAAWLVAVTPFAVQFSQEARMYTLVPLLVVLSADRFLAYLSTGRRRDLVLHSILLAATCYTHYWGLFLFPACGIVAAARHPHRLRGWLYGAAGAFLLYSPWLTTLLHQLRGPSPRIIEMIQEIPAWQLPFRSLFLFAGGVGTAGGQARSLLPVWAALAVSGAWLLLLLGSLRRTRSRLQLELALIGTIPIAAAAFFSGIVRPVYLLGRYEILVLPVLLAGIAAAAAGLLKGVRLRLVVIGWAGLLCITSALHGTRIDRRFPEPPMAEKLAERIQPGEKVVFAGIQRVTMDYHLRRLGKPISAHSFPGEAATHLGWYLDDIYAPENPALISEARQHCPAENGRTWLVATRSRMGKLLVDEIHRCALLTSPFLSLGEPYTAMLLALPRPRQDSSPGSD